MKKQILILSAVLMSLGVFAQKFHYGVRAGANFAVQSDIAEYFNNNDIRTALSVGAFGNYALNDRMQLQAELNYEQKGAKDEDFTAKYDYLTVPVLFKYSLGKSDKTALTFNVNLGPYAGFLMKSEIEGGGQTIDMKDNTESFEAGAIAGFGMKYPIKNNHLVLDLRLGLGLTSFDKNETDLNNKYIGLSLGYEF
jgi:hypothetical protein